MLRVIPIESRHVSATAELLSQAMGEDSAYCYLFENARAPVDGLARFFHRNLLVHLPHHCTYVGVDESDRVVGTVTLRPPSGVHISMLTMLRRGLLPFVLNHGFDAARRLFWLKDTYDGLEMELASGRAHWHVHMMAIQPELQGRGLGFALLESVLSRTVARTQEVDAVLTTHLHRNVIFYQRAQFERVWQRTLDPPGGVPYTVWGMTRPSRPHPRL